MPSFASVVTLATSLWSAGDRLVAFLPDSAVEQVYDATLACAQQRAVAGALGLDPTRLLLVASLLSFWGGALAGEAGQPRWYRGSNCCGIAAGPWC